MFRGIGDNKRHAYTCSIHAQIPGEKTKRNKCIQNHIINTSVWSSFELDRPS